MKKRIGFTSIILLFVILGIACSSSSSDSGGNTNTGTSTSTGTGTSTGTTPSWSSEVYPYIVANCGNCHNSGGLDLDENAASVYTTVQGIINTSDPSSSALLVRGLGSSHTAVLPSTSDANYQMILAWITAGAPDN